MTAPRILVLRGKDQYRRAFAGDSVIVYVRSPATIDVASAGRSPGRKATGAVTSAPAVRR